jgi:hypothetical protein
MSGLESLKDLVKPPFANYDIVVYFGCGLFSLPFFNHYVGRHEVHFLKFDLGFKPEFANTVITTLVLLFSVYICGHIVAYVSSLVIEKTMDAFFGKTSTVVILGGQGSKGAVNSIFRSQLQKGFTASFSRSAWLSGVFRLGSHLPLGGAYAVLIVAGVFGFYRTRVPKDVITAAETKLGGFNLTDTSIAVDKPWFKVVEACVINNNSTATSRMYNYLVISGLFRSLCLIFLAASWFEMVYVALAALGYYAPPGLLMLGHGGIIAQIASYFAITIVYLFCLFSYLKFQRRYVEEAIFAFVFTK